MCEDNELSSLDSDVLPYVQCSKLNTVIAKSLEGIYYYICLCVLCITKDV